MNHEANDRYFDRNGNELALDEILPDMSNVRSVIRTQTMTKRELEQLRNKT